MFVNIHANHNQDFLQYVSYHFTRAEAKTKSTSNASAFIVTFKSYYGIVLPCVNIAEPSDLLKTFN